MEKMTKRDYFAKIREIVAEDAELVAFIDHEVELLERKNARRSDKPTAKQLANATLMDEIYAFMEDGKRYTVTEIHKAMPSLADYTGNKVSALMRGLRLDGRVIRTEEKNVAYFSKA